MADLVVLLAQIAVIIAAARLVGALFVRMRQPQVMGEMIAGILLGPSLLGWVAPGLSAALFPANSLAHLNTLSQIGLLLFMFIVGLEFDPRLLRNLGHAALVTSHASITAPFLLGSLLALYLYPRLSDTGVEFPHFALFMGAAMSITAFPVLARILTEKGLQRSKLGAMALACAAVDDITAWCMLAYIIALVRSVEQTTPIWMILLGLTIYLVIMIAGVSRLLKFFDRWFAREGKVSHDMLSVLLICLLLSAVATERMGIHLLFGAFLFGALLPKTKDFVHQITQQLEGVTLTFFLPIFFAFTGLRTSIGLVRGWDMWFFCIAILFVAVAGKLGGTALAARRTGLEWRDAVAIGVLMNTRGLMELVILNIGLQLGVISPALFSMMVVMAVVTTMMTTPLLEWIYPARLIREQPATEEAA